MSIDIERIGEGIALLTINRPDRLNALDHPHVEQLHAAFDELHLDESVLCVVLTGAGRTFSAGLDLKDAGQPPRTEGMGTIQTGLRWQKHFGTLVTHLRAIRPVTLAAVNGAAIGAGFGLVLAAELRVAGPAARFAVANIKVGLSGCDVGISFHLPKVVGLSRAAELMLTGRFVEAEEAERIGIVSRLCDDAVSGALELAREVVQHSPFGIWMTKEVFWQNLTAPSLAAAIDLEDRTQILAGLSLDAQEAAAAFVEKRRPRYHNT
jgi:enoyl-CoA hydratase